MELYFFDVDDNGRLFVDDVGTECADIEAAKIEASHALTELAIGRLPGSTRYTLAIHVRNFAGKPVLTTSMLFEVRIEQ